MLLCTQKTLENFASRYRLMYDSVITLFHRENKSDVLHLSQVVCAPPVMAPQFEKRCARRTAVTKIPAANDFYLPTNSQQSESFAAEKCHQTKHLYLHQENISRDNFQHGAQTALNNWASEHYCPGVLCAENKLNKLTCQLSLVVWTSHVFVQAFIISLL